jgi:hypothetical protein
MTYQNITVLARHDQREWVLNEVSGELGIWNIRSQRFDNSLSEPGMRDELRHADGVTVDGLVWLLNSAAQAERKRVRFTPWEG